MSDTDEYEDNKPSKDERNVISVRSDDIKKNKEMVGMLELYPPIAKAIPEPEPPKPVFRVQSVVYEIQLTRKIIDPCAEPVKPIWLPNLNDRNKSSNIMAGKRFRHTPYWFRMHKKYKIQDSLIPALEVTPEIISPRGKAKKPHEPDYKWLNADQKE